jgi:hypothetical protein
LVETLHLTEQITEFARYSGIFWAQICCPFQELDGLANIAASFDQAGLVAQCREVIAIAIRALAAFGF